MSVNENIACDCREERIKTIFRKVLKEHNDILSFLAGFSASVNPCKCHVCQDIIDLYGDLLLNTSDN